MSKLIIEGGKKLNGEIDVQGAKNSVLPVLAATLLCKGSSVIHNCPDITDVDISLKILAHLGCNCFKEGNDIIVDSTDVSGCRIPDELMREMRSSVVFLGAILARMGKAIISSPGGCELGPRPIDLHLLALERLGVSVTEEHGYLVCESPKLLCGCEIDLSFPSVGATENIILAAVNAEGTTVIHNAAKEPEISDLGDFLNSAGAAIYGCGSDTIVIHGRKKLYACEHTIIPDRIAAVTYMSAVAATGGQVILNKVMPSHMVSMISVFRNAGCSVEPVGHKLRLIAPKRLKKVPTVKSLVYPAFPTDAGPLIIAMLCVADGTSVFVENIFENRFRYVDELKRLGARIKTEGKVAVIDGVRSLSAADCECTDLRGGAAMVIAALVAEGKTTVNKIFHIKRGYEDIAGNMKKLGGIIYEEE